ncbi:MAG: PadR family transcriptional regulator [Candidatus Omnitrophica bacterium]|nr:PadR family transcriptional regulator [Candidatus Omnitrophota bacterium]
MKRDITASTIDLIILGILFERPINAHDLARLIDEKGINRFLKISAPAVYKSCKRLYEAGFLDGKIAKEGKQPEKTIYRINEKGKERFFALMEHFSSLDPTPFFMDLNVFIWNIEKAGKQRGLKMLKKLRDELSNLKAWIIEHEKEEEPNLSFASKAIVKQYRMTVSTLLRWCEETLEDYKKLSNNK